MASSISLSETALRLLVALACGALLGWERESQHKPAGFRTNILIVLGAATYAIVTLGVASEVDGAAETTRADVLRMIQGVAGGIGFLGAGTIIQSGGSISGMTTAATIWMLGAIGIACGSGQFSVAVIAVAFAMLVLTAFGFIEKRTIKRDRESGGVPPATPP